MAGQAIAVLHLNSIEPYEETVQLLGEAITISHIGCDGEPEVMAAEMERLAGKVSAIALQGVALTLQLGREKVTHQDAGRLAEAAGQTPVVDGDGVRAALERWAVRLAADAQPGIWSQKRVLMVPGLNHPGLAQALSQYAAELRYADPVVYYALPGAPLVGWSNTMEAAGSRALNQMRTFPFRRLFPRAGKPGQPRSPRLFAWADVLAGDMGAIRRYSPDRLRNKIVVVDTVGQADLEDLTARGVSAVVTTVPPLNGDLSGLSAAAFEACLVALRKEQSEPLTENTYLNLMADLEWKPGIRFLQPGEAEINRFAFVIHPLAVRFIHKYPPLRWTRFLPDRLVERVAAHFPPLYMSRIKGVQSPTTGQKVEGHLISLGGTPRELMRRDPGFVYRRLIRASRMAERMGARIMGLGAFTSVVGDAGITVAQKADIAITSGNSLTVAATLEAAKQAVVKMGNRLDESHQSHVMVIGATGSIGSVCSRLLAQAGPSITLVAPRPERLIALKRTIESETPGARVTISTTADDYVDRADLIVTTTTALNTTIVDISKCKPGAVICDIARPPDITEEEAALRPDVLVIESGEILLPGEPDYGYDIGLPPGVAYACLAETALLALEGRFEDYTLGRNIEMERVKEMYRLFKKHQLQLSGLRSHGKFLTDEDIARKRQLAEELRRQPEKLAELMQERAGASRPILLRESTNGRTRLWTALGTGMGAALLSGLLWRRSRDKRSRRSS